VSAQRPSSGDYPLKRRRIHFWSNWTHFGRGGPLSWLIFAPILAIILGAAAVPFILRRRLSRKRGRGDFVSPPPDVLMPPNFGTQVFTPPPMAPPPSPVPPPPAQTHDRLARLDKLHESGALTDEEFLAQRQRILGG
jgi:hypothetical protein